MQGSFGVLGARRWIQPAQLKLHMYPNAVGIMPIADTSRRVIQRSIVEHNVE